MSRYSITEHCASAVYGVTEHQDNASIQVILDFCHKNFEYIVSKITDSSVSEKASAKTGLINKQVETKKLSLRHIRNTHKPTLISSYKWDIRSDNEPLTEDVRINWQWRQMKSLEKFATMIEEAIGIIYNEADSEAILENYSICIDNNDFILKRSKYIDYKGRPIVTDGFIMEGKTDWFTNRGVTDSEADIFWRRKLINGKELEQKYYFMFQVYSHYKSYLMSIAKGYSFYSMSRLFSNAIFDNPNSGLWTDFKSYDYYVRIIANLILIFTHSRHIKVEVLYFKNKQMPWPFLERRQDYEGKIYADELSLNKAALNFYANLDICFAEYALAEKHYQGVETLAAMAQKKRKLSESFSDDDSN